MRTISEDKLVNIALATYMQAAYENDFLAMLICMGVVYSIENKTFTDPNL